MIYLDANLSWFGYSVESAMEKAGLGVARKIDKVLKKRGVRKGRIAIFCGPGNKGGDGLSGTADDLIYRLSDSAGYASQHYFAAIDPARSRHPVVTETYYRILSLNWDLNLDGLAETHALLKIRGSQYDGMMPAPTAVSLPGASWLLGSGLAVLGVTARRRKRPA